MLITEDPGEHWGGAPSNCVVVTAPARRSKSPEMPASVVCTGVCTIVPNMQLLQS